MNALWRSETNWTVSRGSLNSTVTFESSDFPIESESTHRKPPLHLLPPPPPSSSVDDFQPCEITLNFSQKKEIRQVYIRSTARAYEIYYAPSSQSDNEYLATVRCSLVEDNETFVSPKEDDWVEVGHVPEGNPFLPNQDYYEATAEINDLEPCMSITLRLLSLRNKDSVYIDTVYLFADHVDTDDSENQTESSAGSSLMTMLVPTLLGLTKSRSLQSQSQNSVSSVGKLFESKPELPTSSNSVFIGQRDMKYLKQGDSSAELTQIQLPLKDEVCDLTMKNRFSDNRAEILLEQLVSRVSKIEDICFRFEENMLKPINIMEARLERVEQQVELLAKNSHCPSCLGFDLNPRSTTSEDAQLCEEFELIKNRNGTHEPPKDTFVTASCDEKEETNDVLESPKKEPKKTISIDDALAAALAGFSSFTKSNNDSFTVIPLEPPDGECLKSNQDSADTTLGSNTDDEASVASGYMTSIPPASTGEEIDGVSNAISPTPESHIADRGNSVTSCSNVILENSCHLQGTSEVEMDSIPPCDNNYKAAKISSFDKIDILKHFPEEQVGSCSIGDIVVDYESPILEALLSNTDADEGVSAIEVGNKLLMDFDDHVYAQDIPPVHHDTPLTSLI